MWVDKNERVGDDWLIIQHSKDEMLTCPFELFWLMLR